MARHVVEGAIIARNLYSHYIGLTCSGLPILRWMYQAAYVLQAEFIEQPHDCSSNISGPAKPIQSESRRNAAHQLQYIAHSWPDFQTISF